MSSNSDHEQSPVAPGHPPAEEQAGRQGVRPIESVDDMAHDGISASDEELEQFLAHVYSARRADLA